MKHGVQKLSEKKPRKLLTDFPESAKMSVYAGLPKPADDENKGKMTSDPVKIIQKALAKRRVTQEQIAERAGVTKGFVTQVLQGRSTIVGTRAWRKVWSKIFLAVRCDPLAHNAIVAAQVHQLKQRGRELANERE